MRKGRLKKGFTLLEMVIYTMLFIILMACVYWIFNATMKYYNVSDCAINLQYNAITGVNTLTRELSESKAITVIENVETPTSYYKREGIIFFRPKPVSADNFLFSYSSTSRLLEWGKIVCYYPGISQGTRYLFRKEYPDSASGTYLTSETNPQFSSYTSYDEVSEFMNANLTRTTVAKYIYSIDYEYDGPRTLYIKVIFEDSLCPTKANTIQLETKVKMRN